MIRVVDIFAGPGGLGEGFSAARDEFDRSVFDVILSVEMENFANETLKLRTFFRQFPTGAPEEYFQHLRGALSRKALYDSFPQEAAEAASRCWQARLGPNGVSTDMVRQRIDAVVGHEEHWVLIGGPPCQAYSLAGRSRNRGIPGYQPELDGRQRLYIEYLQILADHRPTVFIMENVKGLLSATLGNVRMFERIREDLQNPGLALARDGRDMVGGKRGGYRLFSLVLPMSLDERGPAGALIRSEEYGIPQARHRVILLGIRDDCSGVTPKQLLSQPRVSVASVIASLPPLRSGLSRQTDSAEKWKQCLHDQLERRWVNAGAKRIGGQSLSDLIRRSLLAVRMPAANRGNNFIPGSFIPAHAPAWYVDERLGGVCNHHSRSHMDSDLFRYFYAACYARQYGKSPSLRHFPTDLLPAHVNVDAAVENGGNYADRFRVQVADRPSTTIVSHISRDGHYYIHPDPLQCRSFTVREAARLQTFPDNYLFCGPTTAQYTQVGNAVPPLLAKQIADIVLDILKQAGVKT
ncbi:MAG: DNA cytosine methyltransferase [Bacteroidia bacterium]|nr:DNA cytosine methyltransferase [Bacteroidia bacterium]